MKRFPCRRWLLAVCVLAAELAGCSAGFQAGRGGSSGAADRTVLAVLAESTSRHPQGLALQRLHTLSPIIDPAVVPMAGPNGLGGFEFHLEATEEFLASPRPDSAGQAVLAHYFGPLEEAGLHRRGTDSGVSSYPFETVSNVWHTPDHDVIVFGDVTIDRQSRRVIVRGRYAWE